MDLKRLETSRLFHRFGFGPRPGEFSNALNLGLFSTRKSLLTPVIADAGTARVPDLFLRDLGPRPAPKTNELLPFVAEMRQQNIDTILWWLDRMALADNALIERMTWFWHGHFATSLDKLNYALPMYRQNQTLRKNALGNFTSLARDLVNDGALQYWLDGSNSTAKSPNENLAREFMELFVLGVNRYTEDDVKALSRAFTGYMVVRSNGECTFNPKRHDTSSVTLLGKTASFDGNSASDYLVSQDNCAQFISERLWFRFASSSIALPSNSPIKSAFLTRDIGAAINSLATSGAMSNPDYSLVKTPVEWFIGVCRALNLQPSKLNTPTQLLNHLDKLSQKPFYPPNVGGWPADEAWLNAASVQYRIAFGAWLIKQADLSSLQDSSVIARISAIADLLGVAEFTSRTYFALALAKDDPARTLLLAICSPEYIVSV